MLKKDPTGLLSLFLIIFGVGFMLASFLTIALTHLIYDIGITDIGNLSHNLDIPRNVSILKTMQIFQSVLLFLIPSAVFVFFADSKPLLFLQLNSNVNLKVVFILLIATILIIPMVNFTTYINTHIPLPEQWSITNWIQNSESQAGKITQAFVNTTSTSQFLLNIIIIGVLAAVGEEIVFRGILQNLLTKVTNNPWGSIIITAFLFSAIHLQFLSFFPRFILGIYLGYLFYRSKSLWYPIIAHFFNNGLAVVFYFVSSKNNLKLNVDTIGTPGDMIILTWITLPILLLMIWRLDRILKKL